MFSANVYIKRRKRLTEQVKDGLILFLGNEESPMNYPDNPYLFRQNSSFLYFFGLDFPSLATVIDINNDETTVYGNDLTVNDMIWMKPQPPIRQRSQEIGINKTAPLNKLENILKNAAAQGRKIHFLPQSRPENVLKIQQLLGIHPSVIGEHVSVKLIKAVAAQRSIKTEEEVERIEAALDISYQMHTESMKMSKPGVCEMEVAGAIEGIAMARGGRISFPIIFSIHGETLHNHYHDEIMQAGDIIVHDSGAESPLHYASDITRTIPVSGKFTDRQKDVYNIVLEAQEKAMAATVPGVEFRDVHVLAGKVLAQGLKGLGLMKGDVDEAVHAGAHALFFQCGLGHMMGLDVHDMEDLGEQYVGYTDTIKRNPQFGICSLRMGKALEVGHVMTVEPGLYFIPQLIDQWKAENKLSQFINYDAVEKYRDFGGIRLEDDVLVVKDGCRILGKPIPKTIEEVEAVCTG